MNREELIEIAKKDTNGRRALIVRIESIKQKLESLSADTVCSIRFTLHNNKGYYEVSCSEKELKKYKSLEILTKAYIKELEDELLLKEKELRSLLPEQPQL